MDHRLSCCVVQCKCKWYGHNFLAFTPLFTTYCMHAMLFIFILVAVSADIKDEDQCECVQGTGGGGCGGGIPVSSIFYSRYTYSIVAVKYASVNILITLCIFIVEFIYVCSSS